MMYPPEFWSWVKWKDKGSPGALPPDVRRYYLKRGWNQAPLTWRTRYALHAGQKEQIPAPTVVLAPVRNLLVWATVTDDAIQQALTLPQRWKHAFSADPTYKPSRAQAGRVQAAGRYTSAWCDCRTTLPAAAKQMAADYQLGGWYGQGENPGEFDVCTQAGGKAAIVNLSALRPDQLALVATAQVLVTNETYYNVNPGLHPDWRNANAGIGGNCIAVYGSASEGAVYTSVQNHVNNGWFNPQTDSIYTEGMTAQDWQTLRNLG